MNRTSGTGDETGLASCGREQRRERIRGGESADQEESGESGLKWPEEEASLEIHRYMSFQ
jgi:hypothetical protein